jgi:Zn-dependent protease with chaperone function
MEGMKMRFVVVFGTLLALAGCDEVISEDPQPQATPATVSIQPGGAAQSFTQVVSRIEPVAERMCRQRTRARNCDFLIRVDPDRRAPPNAYQTEDKNGRPVLMFTQSILKRMSNADELAFVMGHEAAHHIRNHLTRQRENATAGAVVFAGLATLTGGSATEVQNAQRIGAIVGARTYSKEFELEADELGTVITAQAGFNPIRGAAFFARIPDPGDRFLGTHPPNAQRVETVRRTARQLGLPTSG